MSLAFMPAPSSFSSGIGPDDYILAASRKCLLGPPRPCHAFVPAFYVSMATISRKNKKYLSRIPCLMDADLRHVSPNNDLQLLRIISLHVVV